MMPSSYGYAVPSLQEEAGVNPHCFYPRDTDAEGQFDPAGPWYDRVRHLFEAIEPRHFVLDVGCNSGGFGRRLLALKPGCRVVGVDLAQHLLPLAEEKGYLFTRQGAAESLSLSSGIFDVVILSEILEHADDPVACVREAARVLTHNGVLLGDVPTWYGRWGYRSLRGHKWHVRAFTTCALRRLLNTYFRDVRIKAEPRWFTRRFLLSQWYTFEAKDKR